MLAEYLYLFSILNLVDAAWRTQVAEFAIAQWYSTCKVDLQFSTIRGET
jgi:hypothetical protein